MDAFFNIFQEILDLGAPVMLPILLLILGLIFRMKFGEALRTGLLVGIGFQGLTLAIDLLLDSINPAIEYYRAIGEGFTTVDIGWAAVGAASWAVPFSALAVLIIIALNILLVVTGVTKVINVDLWNYIHFLIPGALAYSLFGSFWLGLIITVGLSLIALFMAEKVAPYWQEYFGLEGTTNSTLSFLTFAWPVGILGNKIIDLIPGIRDLDFDMDKIEDKIGFFADPAVIGLAIGALIGLLTEQSWQTLLSMGVGIAAALVLLPRMVSIMMEGLSSIGDAARDFMGRFIKGDDEVLIGMDVALGVGDIASNTTYLLLIPISIGLAFILPNFSYLPVGLLTNIIYMMPLIAMASKGNLLRTFIIGFVFNLIVMIGANAFAPEATAMMQGAGIEVEGLVTDAYWGFNLPNIIISIISRILGFS